MVNADRKLLERVRRMLSKISVRGAPEDVFDALKLCAPIMGGLVGSIRAGAGAAVSRVVKLPPDIFEGWASTPAAHLARMLSPLQDAPPGALISDTQAITGSFREELELLDCLRAAGLGETAGYKVSTSGSGLGGAVHRFLTFALDGRQRFTARQRRLLARLQPDVQAALDRLRVPLIASQSILAQIVDEETAGFLCVTRERRVIELNQRASTLIARHLAAARIERGRKVHADFVARALEQTSGGRTWRVTDVDGSGLRVNTHWLAKESHAIREDLHLIMIRDLAAVPSARSLEDAGLTKRQMEIARLLCTTGLSYKECAAQLGIADATMRTHVANVYRRLGVRSRPELVALLR